MALSVNSRWITVHTPVKVEKVHITSDGTNDDPLVSSLANPTTVEVKSVNTDLAGTGSGCSATLSGRTATLRDAAAQDYIVEFTGF
jgi:hypothetical protein